MKRLILTALVALLTTVAPALAQQAGTNVNVLPVVPASSGDPDWYLKGDGYLQRQVEPTIAASTVNPDHLLAFFNDYRAVDQVDGDVGLGEGDVNAAALKLARILLPPDLGATLPEPGRELVPPMNAAEAWIGGSRSYDGGYTWSGFYLPGAPANFYLESDPPTFSTQAPVYGLDASTDPVLAPGPCGTFYLVFVAFTRGGESKLAVARYRDTNDLEGGDTIVYEGMTVIESGNNAEYGYFLDKPDIEVDLLRSSGADQCGHQVYVTYSTFNGLTKDQKVQTKMTFARSIDGGLTFSTTKINKNFGQNQGSAIAVDPRPGTPKTTGGGTVYVFWRHFFDPDAIIWTRTLDYGVKWSAPAILTDSTPLVPFDQPTISTDVAIANGFTGVINEGMPETGFRSNGFPTAAVAPYFDSSTGKWDATVYVAWQERVGTVLGTANFKEPLTNGSPRIVMMRSDADTPGWTGFDADSGAAATVRQAVDLGDRHESLDPYFSMPPLAPAEPTRAAGPQVQPKLSFGGGRLMLTFYESRGRIADYGTADETIESNPILVDQTPSNLITGYDRVMDFRTALLDPKDGTRRSSAQISRYPIRFGANLDDGQDLSDIAAVNYPCYPDSGDSGDPICVRQVNRVNAPTSAQGSSPFIGDYPDTVPYVQFVPNGSSGWRWAIEPTDVPNRGFHAIWTDNRHLIPPEGSPEWLGYTDYGPPGIGGACVNPGSRNTDVLTSRVATEVLVSAPTTYKQLDRPRSFPFSISNTTGEFRRFQLDITDGTEYATFSPKKEANGDPVYLDTYTVIVFPYSNSSLTVYVYPPDVADPTAEVGTIQVEVTLLESTTDPDKGTGIDSATWEDTCYPMTEDCLVGTISFNANPGNGEVQNIAGADEDFGPEISNAFVINWKGGSSSTTDPATAFVINNFLDNAFVINAFVINSDPDNAFVINDGLDNAFVINTEVQNAFVINRTNPVVYGISDTVWTMTPSGSNTAATYVPLINIDNAAQLVGGDHPYYAFQLIVDKQSAYGSVDACASYNVAQQQVLANVVQNPSDPNAFVINDFVENAFVINTEVQNAFVINSAFSLPPSGSGGSKSLATKAGVIDDSEARGQLPPNAARITLRAFQLRPDDELPLDPFTGNPIKYSPEIAPPSLTVFHEACDPADPNDICYATNGADLVIDNSIDTSDLSAHACGTVDFPAFTMRNQGNAAAIARPKPVIDANGDTTYIAQKMRHAIFLSDDPTLNVNSDTLLVDTEFYSAEYSLAGQFDPEREPAEEFEESFASQTITLSSDIAVGEHYLILYVDYPREASEYNETNNTVAVKLTVTAVDPPGTEDAAFTTNQGVAVDANLAAFVSNPNGYEPLTYAVDVPPGNGTVQLDPTTGAFTYIPNPAFVGIDTFAWTVSYCNVTSLPATVTITVLPSCDWVFVGLKSPLDGVLYTAQAGSVVPLAWMYKEPNGTPVDSSGAAPSITFQGWPGIKCSDAHSAPAPIDFVLEEDPGSSDLRYSGDSWQFNWQSKYPNDWTGETGQPGDPLPKGCYEITVTLENECAGKTNGPFQVFLK
jgi:hypothetical protein